MPRNFDPRAASATKKPAQAPVSEPIIKAPGAFEPMEQVVGQDNPRTLSSTGDAREALEPALIEPVDRPMEGLDNEKLAMLAFMDMDVEIHIHSTNDKDAEQIFELFINGQREVFRRNEKKVVKRRFVDLLARLKPTTYTQQEVTKSDGVKDIVYHPHTGLRYPFSVVRDPHPRGGDWLRSVLAEA